jgi:xanthine dehydrogenase accessory factor
VESSLAPLLPLLERERAANRPVALAVVVHTAGSTYRKPGALMLIAADGRYAGLLSGGCLETDLQEHARAVIETGEPRTVTYDLRGPDDLLWGLGVGCEGAMQIFLLRVGPMNGWQPLEHLAGALRAHARTAVGIAIESALPEAKTGSVFLPAAAGNPVYGLLPLGPQIGALLDGVAQSGRAEWFESSAPHLRVFTIPLALPPRILLLGAGPDAMPVVDMATRLAWKVTVYDHRPAYAQAMHFPTADRILVGRPDELANNLDLSAYDAAVVMSHHLPSDLSYLRVLSGSALGYVGLLGPAVRRERLLSDLGAEAQSLRGRLRAPVGLALGGRAPESIALAIVAEIHAYLHGREGGPFTFSAGSSLEGQRA